MAVRISLLHTSTLRVLKQALQLYISCRLATLTAVICDLIGFNVMQAFNCRVRGIGHFHH